MKIEQTTVMEYNLHKINSIKQKYPELRQASKPITFALTYSGTAYTLQKDLNLPEEQAKFVENKYHELYKVSDNWVKQHIDKACTDGYVTCAFGLRLRTPLIQRAIMGDRKTLKEARAEARTAGNALGQSWCLLTNRALNEVMEIVWNSEHATDILPCCAIHDALYFFIKDDIELISWFNKVLIKAMSWQEDPEIQHDRLKLTSSLDIFYPDWAHPIELPNNASKEDIIKEVTNAKSNQ